jgi:plastocyanin
MIKSSPCIVDSVKGRTTWLGTGFVVVLLLLTALQFGPTVRATNSTVSVGIRDFSFNPNTITVVIGVNNTVVWTNNGTLDHTVTANGGSFLSGDLAPGLSFTNTFTTPGTFPYHCSIHPVMKGTVIVLGSGSTTSTTSTSASTTATTSTSTAGTPPKLPKVVTAYVPVVLHNLQSTATGSKYAQMLIVNSSKYLPFEAPGLGNVMFFTQTGATIPSWLESGNSNTASSTTYWLKIGKSIPANGNLVVYMGFASLSANLFNGRTIGEAPQLSQVYGAFDSGKSVFSFYDNFKAQTSNSAWVASLASGGSFNRNNALAVTFGASPGYLASGKKFGSGTAFDALVTSFGDGNNLGYLLTTSVLHNAGNGKPNWAGAFVRSSCNRVFPDQLNVTGEANACGATDGYFFNGTTGVSGVYSVGITSSRTSTESINYSQGNTTQPLGTHYPKFPTSVGFTGQGGSLSAQWARVRVAPPNGVMPPPSFGSVHVIITIAKGASLSSSNPSFVPQTVTVTVGSIVTWTNRDTVSHTVSSNSFVFDSGTLAPKASFTFTFLAPGTYKYHCNFHSFMTGTIVVVSG